MKHERTRWLFLPVVLFVVLSGCNNPFVSFGQKIDTTDWIDIAAPGSMPLVRTWDNGHGNSIELLILEGLDANITIGNFGVIDLIRLEDNTETLTVTTTLLQGAYTTAPGNIQFDVKKYYSLISRSSGGNIPTSSSQSETDISQTVNYSFSLLTATTVDINSNTYEELDTTIDRVMALGADGDKARALNMLYQITAVNAPQSRVAGFGGPDMLNYTTPTDFGSLMNNQAGDHYMKVSLKQTLKALATFSFNGASDLKPFVLDGQYQSNTDFYGSGTLEGIVNFTLKGTTETWNCQMDYNDIHVEYTIPDSGTYLVSAVRVSDGASILIDEAVSFDNTNPGLLDYSLLGLP